MVPVPDYYRLLGLPRDATKEEIRRKYRLAALRYHPDQNTNPGDTEIFLQVQEAYQVLSDPQKRAAYDATLPPEPVHPRELALQTYYSVSRIRPLDEPQLIYAMLEISALNTAVPKRAPLNICLVVDKSTSMQGKKMDMTKSAAIKILRHLTQDDVFSVVTFSDYADVVVPAGFLADLPRTEARIQMLQPSGGTEIYRGLQLAFNEVRRFRDDARVNHIILLTDGRTYGDEEQSLALAERAASEGIVISAIGLGTDWNDNFLDALVSRAGGNSAYIADANEIEQFLLGKVQNLENLYASDVVLDYFLGEHLALTYVYRVQPNPMALEADSPLFLGSVPYNQSLQIIFEFTLDSVPPGTQDILLLSGNLQADILQQRGKTYRTHVRLMRPVSADAAPDVTPVLEKKLSSALADMALYRLQEKAHQQADAGNSSSAARYLQYLATQLFEKGHDHLAKTALLEAENLAQRGRFSEAGRKDIKYGTRALLLSPERRSKE